MMTMFESLLMRTDTFLLNLHPVAYLLLLACLTGLIWYLAIKFVGMLFVIVYQIGQKTSRKIRGRRLE